MDLTNEMPSIHNLSALIKDMRLSPYDLVSECLDRIKKLNPLFRAFVSVFPEDVLLERAKKCERLISNHEYIGPLHGIPYSVKDLIDVKGLICTAGLRINSNHISQKNALLVRRLNKQGAILIGTNNLNELASGITGKNPVYGDSKNPFDVSRISGGSSGGSAVAVSTGMVVFAIGTDTAGSVRVPSSLCGVVGLKPSYNSIPMNGILPLAPSLDHVGIMTRTVADSFLVYDLVHKGRKNIQRDTCEMNDLKGESGVTLIGFPRNYFLDELDEDVGADFDKFLKILRFGGFLTKKINFEDSDDYYPSWKTIRLYESAKVHSNLMQQDTGKLTSEVKKMLIAGSRINEKDYQKARDKIKKVKKKFYLIFDKHCDVLLLPTVPIRAPRLRQMYNGNEMDKDDSEKSFTRYLLLRNTSIFNSIGFPALTIPIDKPGKIGSHSLPVGLQMIAAPSSIKRLNDLGVKFEKLIWQISASQESIR